MDIVVSKTKNEMSGEVSSQFDMYEDHYLCEIRNEAGKERQRIFIEFACR